MTLVLFVPDEGATEHFVLREYVDAEALYRTIRWNGDPDRCSLCRKIFGGSRRLYLRTHDSSERAALCRDCVTVIFQEVDL